MVDGWVAFPAGILISTVVTAVGIGGGILWMPFFILLLKLPSDTAILTSLLIQTFGKGSGSFAYLRQGSVDLKAAAALLSVAMPGVATGAVIASRIRPSHLELLLGSLVLATAFLFVSSNQRYTDTGTRRVAVKTVYRYSWVALTVSVGSGMLSTGLGEWLIPIMRNRLGLNMRNAIATCIFVTFVACVAGAGFHIFLGGRADWNVIRFAVPGVIIGGQAGPKITRMINERRLKEIFIFLMTLIGIHLIYNSY